MVDATNDGVLNRTAVACRDEISYNNYDNFANIGGASGLNADYYVTGDIPSTGNGSPDTIILIPYNGYDPTGFCGQGALDGRMHSTWYTLTFNAHYIDLHGDYAADTLDNSVSSADTWLIGGDGADQIYNRATTAVSQGNNGDDNLCSYVSGSSDEMDGNDGLDCLRDYSTFWNYLSCGGGFNDHLRWTGADPSSDGSCDITGSGYTCGC